MTAAALACVSGGIAHAVVRAPSGTGVRRLVCCPDSREATLIGVSAELSHLVWSGRERSEAAAMSSR
jgi:hypothetical protein